MYNDNNNNDDQMKCKYLSVIKIWLIFMNNIYYFHS
jgi:hypothetical protein